MAEKKQTPEEKLLRMIESPAKETKDIKSLKKGLRFFSLAWIKKAGLLKDRFKTYSLFSLKTINRVLVVASFMSTAYLIFDFVKARPDVNQIYRSDVLQQKVKEAKPASRVQILNLSDYLSEINKRDIFHFIPVKKEAAIPTARETMVSLVANLKLVGIIWGRSPQAMIEDRLENKTLLLNQGENIRELKIKQILRDRVILSYEDQEMELM